MIAARALLRIDVAGAFLTSVVHGAVFATGVIPTGIPAPLLLLMALAAAGFGVIGLVGLSRHGRIPVTLQRVAGLNVLFSLVSAALWLGCFGQLTRWGLLYFPAEIVVLLGLARLEWHVATTALPRPADLGC